MQIATAAPKKPLLPLLWPAGAKGEKERDEKELPDFLNNIFEVCPDAHEYRSLEKCS